MHVEILVPLGVMAMVVLIVWFKTVGRRQEKERQAEILRQLIDKFSSGEDFAQALQGPAGATLADALALEGGRKPRQTWLGLAVPAFVLTFIGLGFLILAAVEDRDLIIPGITIGAVGAGLLVATLLAWRVEKREREDAERTGGSDRPDDQRTSDGP